MNKPNISDFMGNNPMIDRMSVSGGLNQSIDSLLGRKQMTKIQRIGAMLHPKKLTVDEFDQMSLEERVRLLMRKDAYKKVYDEISQKKMHEIKEDLCAQIRREHPELGKRAVVKNMRFSAATECSFRDEIADFFWNNVFTQEDLSVVLSRLFNPQAKFSQEDHDFLKIRMYLWRHNPEKIIQEFGVKTGAFPCLLARNAIDLANIVGGNLRDNPCAILYYGVECCKEIKGFDRGEIAVRADNWVGQWLDPQMLRILTPKEAWVPSHGQNGGTPTKAELKKAAEYQAEFKNSLAYYFLSSPTIAQKAFQMTIPFIEKADPELQTHLWEILFVKCNCDPCIIKDVTRYMSAFLDKKTDLETQKIMYTAFVEKVSPDMRAQVLGSMSSKDLKRYWDTFRKINPYVTCVPVKTENESSYLAWHLFHQGEISDEQMVEVLKGAKTSRYEDFVFSNKKRMDTELFIRMCDVFANSPVQFWKWVKSFRGTKDFKANFAKLYPMLPNNVRENKDYVVAMDSHFQLVRECAVAGDTGSLSVLKKILGKEVWWQSLASHEEGQISGARSLCRQGKRGFLRLIADMPIAEQQKIFMMADEKGRTLLDDCPSNFARLVMSEVFKQAIVRETLPEEVVDRPVAAEPLPVKSEPEKTHTPRKIFKLPLFNSHLEKIATIPGLVKEVEDTVTRLAQLSKAEIQAEMRGGIKCHGSLKTDPCMVKDIRGNNYRLGYILEGDTDQGTGKIAFLFFLTHAQYNVFLNKQAAQAVRAGRILMARDNVTPNNPTNPGPVGPGGGHDGR